MKKTFARLLCLLGLAIVMTPVWAADKTDVPALVRQASKKYQAKFKTPGPQALRQLDDILVSQYHSKGRMASEKNGYLKQLYAQSAELLMNGYPIAGGTVISVARELPVYKTSPAGVAMARFVDTMLTPSEEEDADLAKFQQRTQKGLTALKGIRPDLRIVAQMRVVGDVYQDPIAVDAGMLGLKKLNASRDEMEFIMRAVRASK